MFWPQTAHRFFGRRDIGAMTDDGRSIRTPGVRLGNRLARRGNLMQTVRKRGRGWPAEKLTSGAPGGGRSVAMSMREEAGELLALDELNVR